MYLRDWIVVVVGGYVDQCGVSPYSTMSKKVGSDR
jgi:hypothetical protein